MGNVNPKPQEYSEIPQEPEDQQSPPPSLPPPPPSSSSSSPPSAPSSPPSPPSSFTCEICIEPVTHPNKQFNNSNICIHPFCTECIIKHIQANLEENVSDIKCPALTCGHSLEPLSCRPKIPRQLFIKWCDALCDQTVLGLDRAYCPYRDCSALVINECDGDVKRCVCPNCKRPFCFRCRVAWHAGYRCEESMDRNDVAFGVLSKKKRWMRCPVCGHCVERVMGCRIVRCRCGVHFCYECGRKIFECNCDESNGCCMLFLPLCIVLGVIYFLYRVGYLVGF